MAAQTAPCGGIEHASHRRGETVHHAQARIRQTHPAEQARQGHVAPRFRIVPVHNGPLQRTRRAANTLQRKRIGDRIGAA